MRCPKCGSTMVLRIARNGKFAGREFYGCSRYPNCTGIVNIESNSVSNRNMRSAADWTDYTIMSNSKNSELLGELAQLRNHIKRDG